MPSTAFSIVRWCHCWPISAFHLWSSCSGISVYYIWHTFCCVEPLPPPPPPPPSSFSKNSVRKGDSKISNENLSPYCRLAITSVRLKNVLFSVIRHLLRRQLLLRWYLQQQIVWVRVMIGFLVQSRVRIKIMVRVRDIVRVGVIFNVGIYHR